MPRFLIALALALFASPVFAADPEPARDGEGHPLPTGAVARLGSMRLQHTKPVAAAVYTHDGKQIVSVGRDLTAYVWDATTGKRVASWDLATKTEPNNLVLSRKGDFVFVGHGGGNVDVYDLPEGKKRFTLSIPEGKRPIGAAARVTPIAVAEDDKSALTVGDGTVTLWDLTTGKATQTHQLKAVAGRVPYVVLTPDAKSFAYEISEGKELVFFDAADGKETKKLSLVEPMAARFLLATTLAFSQDGKTIFVARDGKISTWETESGKLLTSRAIGGAVFAPTAFSAGGRLLLVRLQGADHIVGALSLQDLRIVRHGSPTAPSRGYVTALSADGKRATHSRREQSRSRVGRGGREGTAQR